MVKHSEAPWKMDQLGVITGGPDFCTTIATVPTQEWTKSSVESIGRGSRKGFDHANKCYAIAVANGRVIEQVPTYRALLARVLEAWAANVPDDKYEQLQEDIEDALAAS